MTNLYCSMGHLMSVIHVFLKLINNSKAKDKGNHARDVISDEKLLVVASLISPSKSFCLRSYIKR